MSAIIPPFLAQQHHAAVAGALSAGTVAVAIAARASFAPASQLWGRVISHGAPGPSRSVALTFDDGPTPSATDRVLDILRDLEVKATFFVIGRNVERHPKLLARIAAEGHLVGNHTQDHRRLGVLRGWRFWREQIEQADVAIARVLGDKPLFFRPPIGHKTPLTLAAAARLGHPSVTWSVRGWDGVPTTSRRILDHVIPRCVAGSIILLHDGAEPDRQRDPTATIESIEPLVRSLRKRGLMPTRLDELLGVLSE